MSTTSVDELATDTTPELISVALGEDEEDEIVEEIPLRSEDFISGPFRSESCTVPDNIFELDYSYGYNCKRHFNLVAPDENILVFASGNLIHFYNVLTKELWFRRSYLAGGIGHITINKHYSHLTVAENGDNPPIIIYDWPSMDIVGVLKDGAAKRYAHINYSPDGNLLVSQSYGPDFLITVWVWKKWRTSPIILRTKSHVHDVYRVMFSPYVFGQITTGGSGHIKFWKMAETFTGLKLQGEIGRFGKTEITDVIGVYPMPDEKVLCGTEWGNILVWEAGLIKIEVFRTMRRRCHNAPVMQLEYNEKKGEIWSISLDGWLRAWAYRIIDEADPPDEDRIVQMIPSYERETPDVQFMCICKKKALDPDDTFYYAQDSNGGIWLIDLILRADYEPSVRLKSYHAGAIVDLAACPWGTYFVSFGDDGRIIIYNYMEKNMLYIHQFSAKGRTLIWVPLSVEPSGQYFILGFDDGVIRVCVITIAELRLKKPIQVLIVQSTKPHTKPITAMSLNSSGNILVSGSEDKTMFIFQLKKLSRAELELVPIGFIPLNTIVTYFLWKPEEYNDTKILLGCIHGEIIEFDLPNQPVAYTKISFLLHTIIPRKQRFITCKAQIRRDIYLKEIEERKMEKVERKKREIAQLKAANPGLEIDEEMYLQDSEEDEVLEPLHIPKTPNKIWFMMFTPEDTIWLSMGGYDAGYIYEYRMDQEEELPIRATIIEDGDDIEMHNYLFSPNEKYLITSMQNGAIRVNTINQDDFRDLSDYWLLNMHDNFNGQITKMCFSYDNKYFFSSGTDGNVFSYKYNTDERLPNITVPKISPIPNNLKEIVTDENYESLSLEEKMIKAEEDKQLRIANERKKKLRDRLKNLQDKLTYLLERNCNMAKSQRYKLKEFIIDDRIMAALDDTLEAKVALERRKLAYNVEKSTIGLRKMKNHYVDCLDVYPIVICGIGCNDVYVQTLPQRGLKAKFYDTYDLVEKRKNEERLKGRLPPRERVKADIKFAIKEYEQELEPFLVGLSPSTISFKFGTKLTRMLKGYRKRRVKRAKRQEQWNVLMAEKPVEGKNHPDDIAGLELAKKTIGDFKLKCSPSYRTDPSLNETTVTKYQQLLDARLRAHKEMVHMYNNCVYGLRDKKIEAIKELQRYQKRLNKIHMELPESRIKQGPLFPEITPDYFPENEMEINAGMKTSFKEYKIMQREKNVKPETEIDNDEESDTEEEKIKDKEKLPDIKGNVREIIRTHLNELNTPQYKKSQNNACEKDMKVWRLVNKLYEQDCIIEEMNNIINDFDTVIKKLSHDRYQTRLNCTFMDLHLLMLNQELIIVKDFEGVENELRGAALSTLNEKLDMRDYLIRLQLNIDADFQIIDVYNERIKDIQQTFATAAKDNKFFDFLRRIFKKKYRPPKVQTDESESSSFSSESSSESEDDGGSLDSRDIGPIRLDENVCPKGCDKELYDYTFFLRTERHELEKAIQEEKKLIDSTKKVIDQSAKKMKVFDAAAKKSQDELEEFERIKQLKINEITVTVLLKLSQLQHLSSDGNKAAELSNCLAFNASALRNLYGRVGELQNETLSERARHRKNKIHLHRMEVDCKHMEKEIKALREEIKEAFILKFGQKVNIDDLEEAILKRMISQLKLAMLNIEKLYEKDIINLRNIYGEKQKEVTQIIRDNTVRLELFRVITKEKADLNKTINDFEEKKRKGLVKIEESYYLNDIERLSTIVKKQQEQIENLKDEIKSLTIKSGPLQAIPPEPPIKAPEPKEDEDIIFQDFGSLDEVYVAPSPSEITIKSKYTPYLDEIPDRITDEDIDICVKELIQEITETIAKKKETSTDDVIITILCEIFEQIPMKFLTEENFIIFIANVLRQEVDEAVPLEKDIIYEQVATITKKSKAEVREIAGNIFNVMIQQEHQPIHDSHKKKSTESESDGKD